MQRVFLYKEEVLPASPAFPEGMEVKRPVLEVTLYHDSGCYVGMALVDTGTDYTVFPKSWADAIGLDLQSAPVDKTSSLGGQPEIIYRDVEIEIEYIGFKHVILAGFTDDLNGRDVGILGNNGFFDRIKLITFDYASGFFVVET
jgi:predicted aspartyl protease